MASDSFTSVQEHSWTVPDDGILKVHSVLLGAGSSGDAYGAKVEDGFEPKSNNSVTVRVGGTNNQGSGGFNGGGNGNSHDDNDSDGHGGGGASDIRVGGTSLSDRVLVAGGAGGGGGYDGRDNGGDGGWTGQDGGSDGDANGGGGGTQTSGGTSFEGTDGSLGQGGAAQQSTGSNINGGGGGGGGYYGGGGGDNGYDTSFEAGGGGGGGSSLASDQSKVTDGFNSGDGEVTLYYVPSADVFSYSTTSDEAELIWDNESDSDIEEIEIYRSTSSLDDDPLSSSPLVSLSPGTTTYTDTTVEEGTGYFYNIVNVGSNTEATETGQVFNITELPEPINLTGDVQGFTTYDISWELQSTDEDGVKVHRKLGDGSFSEVADLPSGSESYSDSGLLHGRKYTYRVEAYTEDASETTSDITVTTAIKDTQNLNLTSNNRGAIESDWDVESDTGSNNGNFYLELTNTEDSSTVDSTMISFTDRDYTFSSNIDDSIEYEVRVRSETEDVIGNFASQTVVSYLPASRIVSIEFTEQEEIVVEYEKNDNFDGGRFELFRSESDSDTGEKVSERPDGTQEMKDSQFEPNTEYYYTINRVTG